MFIKKTLKVVSCLVTFTFVFCYPALSYFSNLYRFKNSVRNICLKHPQTYYLYSENALETRISKFINFEDITDSDKSILNFYLNTPILNICEIMGLFPNYMCDDIDENFYKLDYIEGYEIKNESNVIYVTLKKNFNFENKNHIKRIFMYTDFQYEEIVTLEPHVAVLLRKENQLPFTSSEILSIDNVIKKNIKKDIVYSCKT